MKKVINLFICGLFLLSTNQAFADGFVTGKVTQLDAQANGGLIVNISGLVTGCGGSNAILLDTTYMTTAAIDQARAILLAAYLSNKNVSVDTVGCISTKAKLFDVSLLP